MDPEELPLKDVVTAYMPLSDELIDAIEKQSYPFRADRKQNIVTQGTPCDDIYFITGGLTRIAFANNSKETTLCFGQGGDIFMSFHAMFAGKNSAFTWQALTDVSGWRLSIHRFRLLQQRFPELYAWETRLLEEQLLSLEALYVKQALVNPEERYTKFWTTRQSMFRCVPVTKLTQIIPVKIIAQYLGMTPNTLARIRRKLNKRL